jgi:hypothetical protein
MVGGQWGLNRENHIYMTSYWKKISRTSIPISIKLGTNHPWINGIQNDTNKRPGPLQGGDNHKNAKMGSGHLKNLLKNHSAKRAQIYMKAFWHNVDLSLCKAWSLGLEGSTIEKTIFTCVYIVKKKIFSTRTSMPISIKLCTNHPWVKSWIQNCSIKGPGPCQRGDNHKNAKSGVRSVKFFCHQEPPSQNSSNLHESFLI